ncbi:MAG: 30S ribosomal protein S16 [Gammaproteobacteria bacterium]|jgi:small subunit ribosomal protein S16|nr:MAG: 30S ribosomal protein S16 [Gammaproteobacteria bacterium]
MVTIRLARAGTKKRPFYHIVVTDSRSKRDGRYLERVGFYNPIATGQDLEVSINRSRFDYWTAQGARMSDRVAALAQNSAVAGATGA